MWLVLLLVAGAAAAALAAAPRSGSPRRVPDSEFPSGGQPGDGAPGVRNGSRNFEATGAWRCRRADADLVPSPEDYIPSRLLEAGGPIVQTIRAGIQAVNQVANAIGWRRRCTVVGGQFVLLSTRQGASLDARVTISIGLRGKPPAASWTFVGRRSESGALVSEGLRLHAPQVPSPVPGVMRLVYSTDERHYLAHGGRPPSQWWPHDPGAQLWRDYLPHPSLTAPAVSIARLGDDLDLVAWLPPRSGAYEIVGAINTHRLVDPAVWQVDWQEQVDP